jgi:hypothetical protein
MSKKVKTKEVLVAWQVLGQAKYDKLDSDQKVHVFHIGQQLKPIATAFSDYSADAAEKMQPSADFQERWDKAKVYETMTANPKADMEQLPMGPAEYKEFMVKEYFPFDRLWKKAIKDDKLVWPNHVSDLKYWSSEADAIYGVRSIPSMFLLDREGRIVAKDLRGEALERAVKQLLEQ